MKTIFCEKDLAFKSGDPDELLEMGLDWIETPKPGLRNELSKIISKSRHEGLLKSKKSPFVAGFDKRRKEYILFIKDEYEPAAQIAMLFELLTEPFANEGKEAILQERVDWIEAYLFQIEKNEDLELREEKSQLIQLTGAFLEMLSVYNEDDQFDEDELERLSEKFDLSFFKPMSEILEAILAKLISGSIPVGIGEE